MQTIVNFITNGGFVMYLILFIFFIGLAILLERAIFLFKSKVNSEEFMGEIFKNVKSGNINNAKTLCSNYATPLTKIIFAGLNNHTLPKEELKESVDEVAIGEIPKLLKRTHYLPLIANVSTLLGLLGTIFGLMKSFMSVAGVDPSIKAQILANGISMAMNTTALGLIAAIPCLLGHSYLTSTTQDIIHDIDLSVTRLVNYFSRV